MLAQRTRLMLGRRLVPRGGKAGIATPSTPSTSDNALVLGPGKIVKLFTGGLIVDDCPNRDRQNNVASVASFPVTPFAVASAFGRVLGVVAEVEQGVVMIARFENDVASATSVSARRTALGHELFPAKGQAAIAAIAGLDSNANFIDKHAAPVRDGLQDRARSGQKKGRQCLRRRPIEMQAD